MKINVNVGQYNFLHSPDVLLQTYYKHIHGGILLCKLTVILNICILYVVYRTFPVTLQVPHIEDQQR
jgi:hypothetical protein